MLPRLNGRTKNHLNSFDDSEWMNRGSCIESDPEWWFKSGYSRDAKKICHNCPVVAECFQYAMEFEGDLFGIWGGISKVGREKMKRNARKHARNSK